VLLIEDSENGVLLLLRELRRGGYEPLRERVQTPKEMEKALVGASSRGEPWGAVVSDYYMPRFGAPAALRVLRGPGCDTPFAMVSGKIGQDRRRRRGRDDAGRGAGLRHQRGHGAAVPGDREGAGGRERARQAGRAGASMFPSPACSRSKPRAGTSRVSTSGSYEPKNNANA
jgi:hypothetical protein